MKNHELEAVAFRGDTIFAVEHDGEPYVPVRPIIENIGLDWAPQYRKLQGEEERWGVAMIATPSAGGTQETTCIPLRKLAGFLATINHRKVRNELRSKVLAYQRECDDALWKYWTEGRAENPRMGSEFKIPETMHEALRLAADLAEKTVYLERRAEADRPKVEFAESIEDSAGSVAVGDFAKLLNNAGIRIGRNRLFSWLREEMYLMLNNMPYQNHVDNGNFVVRERTRPSLNGPVPYFQTRITGKGQMAIERKLREGVAA